MTKKTLFFSLLVLLGGLKNLACVQGEDDENMHASTVELPSVPADSVFSTYGVAAALPECHGTSDFEASAFAPLSAAPHLVPQPVLLTFAPEPDFEVTCDERSVFESVLAGEKELDLLLQSLDLSCLNMTNDELEAVMPLLPQDLKALNLKVNNLKVHGNLPLFQALLVHCENLEYIGFDCTVFETRNISGHCLSPQGKALQDLLKQADIQLF